MKELKSPPPVGRKSRYDYYNKPKKTELTIAEILSENGYSEEEIKQIQKEKKILVRVGHLGRKLRSGDILYRRLM